MNISKAQNCKNSFPQIGNEIPSKERRNKIFSEKTKSTAEKFTLSRVVDNLKSNVSNIFSRTESHFIPEESEEETEIELGHIVLETKNKKEKEDEEIYHEEEVIVEDIVVRTNKEVKHYPCCNINIDFDDISLANLEKNLADECNQPYKILYNYKIWKSDLELQYADRQSNLTETIFILRYAITYMNNIYAKKAMEKSITLSFVNKVILTSTPYNGSKRENYTVFIGYKKDKFSLSLSKASIANPPANSYSLIVTNSLEKNEISCCCCQIPIWCCCKYCIFTATCCNLPSCFLW